VKPIIRHQVIFVLNLLLAVSGLALEASGNEAFRRVAEMVNDERQKVGLPRLAYNNQLEQAAVSHSKWMAKVQKMEHLQGQKPEGFETYLNSDHHHSMRITKTGYLKWQDLFDVTREGNTGHIRPKPDADERASEIIAFASRGAGPIPKQLPIVVPGWMKSPGHRAVIVKTCWKDIGAAFAFAKDGSTYYCVTFGNRPAK
jgi:uncharacterized protein YkwD